MGCQAPDCEETTMQTYEKLGVFYLGRQFDPHAGRRQDNIILYDSKDLVTHGVCVGMTGSGKTGLCLCILEEAALDGIPVIAIDPKGDLCNLLLTFPNLAPEDFRPWINEDDARRKGMSADEFAAGQAATWKQGLAEWAQDGERISRLRAAADFAIYTPGSTAGLPLSMLRSLDAPPVQAREDRELLTERITTTVTSLLTLAGIEADPVRSREHILLSTILDAAWSAGQNLDLASLIRQIQQPSVTRVGVLDLESFFPAGDRFGLAAAFNNVLAAPGFEAWLEGEPFNVDHLFYARDGRPRVSIISIAHLDDRERMFVVSMLLNELVGWMRAQSGTTSLRALVYMDEIFGFFPPVANPPSKKPLLTLLKQGRAFGLGTLLATQNPVDLDYKGLSNAGTWLLGRLQTERDKARVLDGLESAMAGTGSGFDRAQFDRMLSGLSNRVFVMNNVHEDAPVVFETRWAMSYLRGPLTRDQIKLLMAPRKAEQAASSASASPSATPTAVPPAVQGAQGLSVRTGTAAAAAVDRPVLPPDVRQFFVPLRQARPGSSRMVYEPLAVGVASVAFANAKLGLTHVRTTAVLASIDPSLDSAGWPEGAVVDMTAKDLESSPPQDGAFAPLPPAASKPKSYDAWSKDFSRWLFQTQQLELLQSPTTGAVSKPDEPERDFRIRLQTLAREQRDRQVECLRKDYAPKLAAQQERIRRAEMAVSRETEQSSSQKLQTAVSVGATVFGALLGRKALSMSTIGRATTAARGVGRTMKEGQDIKLAQENLAAEQQKKADLEAELQAKVSAMGSMLDPMTETLQLLVVKPKRTDISLQVVALAWAPTWEDEQGTRTRAWE
jgi:hypothetical protein